MFQAFEQLTLISSHSSSETCGIYSAYLMITADKDSYAVHVDKAS